MYQTNRGERAWLKSITTKSTSMESPLQPMSVSLGLPGSFSQ